MLKKQQVFFCKFCLSLYKLYIYILLFKDLAIDIPPSWLGTVDETNYAIEKIKVKG